MPGRLPGGSGDNITICIFLIGIESLRNKGQFIDTMHILYVYYWVTTTGGRIGGGGGLTGVGDEDELFCSS